jgi:hypothetical protein
VRAVRERSSLPLANDTHLVWTASFARFQGRWCIRLSVIGEPSIVDELNRNTPSTLLRVRLSTILFRLVSLYNEASGPESIWGYGLPVRSTLCSAVVGLMLTVDELNSKPAHKPPTYRGACPAASYRVSEPLSMMMK